MAAPSAQHDVAAGGAVAVWVLGMGLVLGVEDAALQLTGGCLWAAGLVVAGGVAAHAYRTRSRHPE